MHGEQNTPGKIVLVSVSSGRFKTLVLGLQEIGLVLKDRSPPHYMAFMESLGGLFAETYRGLPRGLTPDPPVVSSRI